MTYDEQAQARDRVLTYIYRNFGNEDIQKLDRIFQNAGRGVVTDQSRSFSASSQSSFYERYPDARLIKVGELIR